MKEGYSLWNPYALSYLDSNPDQTPILLGCGAFDKIMLSLGKFRC
jgi:hypothetical protein